MAPPASRIYDVCSDLLGAVVANHGGALPDRSYVSAGAPAWDCELLATWCERTAGFDGDVTQEATTALPGAAHTMRVGVFVITMLRCTPAVIATDEGMDPVLPSEAQEEAAATLLYEDAQRCLNAVVAADKAGDLGGCHGVAFMDWRTLGPEGGMVAGELRVRVGLTSGL